MNKIILVLLLLTVNAFSQIISVNMGGTTSFSSWSNINSYNYSGYGSFPGNTAWPSPIQATSGSSNSSLNRISGSLTGGGPFLASDSIYFGNYAQVTNAFGGTLRLSNSSSFTNIKTLVLQVQIGEVTGYDFFTPSGFPKLTLNGITNFASYTNLVNRYQNGTFPSPQTGSNEPVYINTWAYQWSITNTNVNSYFVDFSAVTHAQVYTMRWDSSSLVYNTPVIPEPSVIGLLALGALGVSGYILRKKIR